MTTSCMNFGRMRDLVSNLGWKEKDDTYTIGPESLDSLQIIEQELLNEDVMNRNIHISLHVCGTVKKDLIPTLICGKNKKLLAITTRILVNLSLPIECLLPVDTALITDKIQNVRKQLLLASFDIKKAFLKDAATFPVVEMLREAMINSEKHNVALNEDDCIHLNNCLMLLQNILHLPEETDSSGTFHNFWNWQSVQNKLIWNLFVQGLDGALLLMLNSNHRAHWTIPVTLIIALLYRNQNVSKVHEALELISSASDTSCDEEESDGSKNSSISLSSEPCKDNKELCDSGYALTSDTSVVSSIADNFVQKDKKFEIYQVDCLTSEIHSKLEKVQISDDSEPQVNCIKSFKKCNRFSESLNYGELDSEGSSSDYHHHKKIKGSTSCDENVSMNEADYSSKEDSGVSENMDHSSADIQDRSSDDNLDKKMTKNFKAVQKLRNLQMQTKVSESDSSNEDMQYIKIKYRSHPPAGKRGKSSRCKNGCIPSVCMESALLASVTNGRLKYPLLEKRNSVATLVDNNSLAPSDEDIGNHIKEFTISFLHSGFSNLVQDLKDLLLSGSPGVIDKSLLFWILSYFLHLSATVHLNVDHIRNILTPQFIGYLVYECVLACESVELHSAASMEKRKTVSDQLSLVVTALKEIVLTADLYARKSSLQKDKIFFSGLHGKLSDFQHLLHVPLLLFENVRHVNVKSFTENVVILNHYILSLMEKGMEQHPQSQKFDFGQHLKHFSTKNVMNSYGLLLENYKHNSTILNESLFTMLHHIAGDVQASESLIEPPILKAFSSILKEDIELEPYQEDLIMYILNKFSLQIQKNHLEERRTVEGECSHFSDHSSSSSSSINRNCLLSEDDDLFWWYLQFEQDKDPIARIAEHIPTSKHDILLKLQLKGIISPEKFKIFEAKMESVEEGSKKLLSCESFVEMENFDEEITHLLRTLVQSGFRQHLTWIQDTLLEICHVKLGSNTCLPEPVPFHTIKMMTSVPLVPYFEEQRLILKDEIFLQLLEKIGFLLGSDMCPIYPRIPLFWTADILFSIAARLGPLRKDKLKFSYDDLLLTDLNHDHIPSRTYMYPPLPALSSCYTLSSWLEAVKDNKDQSIS